VVEIRASPSNAHRSLSETSAAASDRRMAAELSRGGAVDVECRRVSRAENRQSEVSLFSTSVVLYGASRIDASMASDDHVS